MLDHKRRGTTVHAYNYFRFAYFPITLIFIWHLLLRRIFSWSAFSFDAYFHLAHSPNAPLFIQRILLWCLFSLCVISYDAYLHSKEGAERKSHFGKSLRDPKCKLSKNLLKHCKMALTEHFTLFIFCVALKKKCILRSRRRCTTIFGALSYGA